MAQRHKSQLTGQQGSRSKLQLSASDLVAQGNALRRAGEQRSAEAFYRRAIEADGSCADAWAELGCCLVESEQHSLEALICFCKVLGESSSPEPSASGHTQEALQLLVRIVAGRPEWITGHLTLGCLYARGGQHEPARAHLTQLLRLDPSLEAPVQSMLAAMHYRENNWQEAIAAVERAWAAGSADVHTWSVHANSCLALGRTSEGMESARRALEIAPSPAMHSTLLSAMNFSEQTTPESFYLEASRWNSLYAAPLARRILPHTNNREPERRLKIGYVSPNLHNHAVMKFIPQLFEHHDSSRFEIFVYAAGERSDSMTEQLRRSIQNYCVMPAAGRELVERVRADGIDILVDLAGHTVGSSLLVFAEKPAPVQVSWIGMLSTTGLTSIDYFLGDPHLPCPGTEHLFSEQVYRLPVLCSYRPFGTVPVAESPCLKRGYITFGSFNSPRKITRDVCRLWSAILHLVPASRLLLKYNDLEKPAVQGDLRGWFAQDGISSDRLQFEGAAPPRQFLEAFGNIDIALDPFPYNGGSTTLDTLWMGVPLVTLAGRLPVQRCGASLLSAAGLNDFITNTPEEYLKSAIYLAATVPNTPDLRAELRRAIESSPLMDEAGVARSVENAYREMWRTWCRTRT